jgi:hypothetical protein
MNRTPLACSSVLGAVLAALSPAPPLAAQGLDGAALRRALEDRAADFWFYDDLEGATELANESGKPLLVSFRCVP